MKPARTDSHGDTCPRIPIKLTPAERAEVDAAARQMGVPMSTFVRVAALEAARLRLRNL